MTERRTLPPTWSAEHRTRHGDALSLRLSRQRAHVMAKGALEIALEGSIDDDSRVSFDGGDNAMRITGLKNLAAERGTSTRTGDQKGEKRSACELGVVPTGEGKRKT